MKISQRDIIEVNFELPDGSFKIHPALVISNENVLEAEDIFYALMISTKPYNDEFTIEIKDSMVSKSLPKKSFIKCQLIQSYTQNEAIRRISTMKIDPFESVKKKLVESVF